MAETARRARLDLSIDGHEVSSELAPYVLDFSFTDNAHGKADEIRLTLHDREGLFNGDWMPQKGMEIKATIICESWEEPGQDLQLPCGAFKIDEVDFSGPPDKVQIKAVASELCGPLRDTKKTRGWEKISLEAICRQVADENGLEPMYYGPDHVFERQDQRNESDLAFVNRLANDCNMNCKTHDGRLILFDADEAEAAAESLVIYKKGGMYSPTSYSFKSSSSGTDYKNADVAYNDPQSGTTHTAQVKSVKKSNSKSADKTLAIQRRAENAVHAAKLGKAELRKANSEEQTSSLEIMGCPKVAAGQTLELKDFGFFSGKYFVRTATHKLGGSYTTSLELTTPSPTEVVKVGNEINQAAEAVHEEAAEIKEYNDNDNEKTVREAKKRYEEFIDSLPDDLLDAEALIICLAEIAEMEEIYAKDKNSSQAWKYLKESFYIWLSSEKNKDPASNANILYIDWKWLMENSKVSMAFHDISANLFNEAARRELCRHLREQGKFSNKIETFNFISTDPSKWKEDHQQSRAIAGVTLWDAALGELDGQEIALGACMLYGLSKGYVKPLTNGKHGIHITQAAIVLSDTFGFNDRDRPLGIWSCSEKKFKQFGSNEGNILFDYHFGFFREKYGQGSDFYVVTKPRDIAEYAGFSYDTSLCK